jgi:hypothetical protein
VICKLAAAPRSSIEIFTHRQHVESALSTWVRTDGDGALAWIAAQGSLDANVVHAAANAFAAKDASGVGLHSASR